MRILAKDLACVSRAIRSGMQRLSPFWDLNLEPCDTFLSEWCYSLSISLLMNLNTSTVQRLKGGSEGPIIHSYYKSPKRVTRAESECI